MLITEKRAANVFEVKDLNLWYNKFHALNNISMDIAQNEVTSIIGPSGCGKSSFIKTLNLMIKRIPGVKLTGELMFDNENLTVYKQDLVDLRQKIGMIFQKGNPFPQSIYKNIAFGPNVQGIHKKKLVDEIVEDALMKVGLWDEVKDRLKTNAFELSGGQQQRLCIARAIATNPAVILMDEPTSALDPVSTLRIEQLILELKHKYSIVMVTHNMLQAARISDKTAFFFQGEMIEYDTAEKIFSNPSKRRTEHYITGKFG